MIWDLFNTEIIYNDAWEWISFIPLYESFQDGIKFGYLREVNERHKEKLSPDLISKLGCQLNCLLGKMARYARASPRVDRSEDVWPPDEDWRCLHGLDFENWMPTQLFGEDGPMEINFYTRNYSKYPWKFNIMRKDVENVKLCEKMRKMKNYAKRYGKWQMMRNDAKKVKLCQNICQIMVFRIHAY